MLFSRQAEGNSEDSRVLFPILFNHRSFQEPAASPGELKFFRKIRISGFRMEMEGTRRMPRVDRENGPLLRPWHAARLVGRPKWRACVPWPANNAPDGRRRAFLFLGPARCPF